MAVAKMCDTDSNHSPIFVVGTPRSGTTLTAKILANHSNLFMPGETHFFDDIYSLKDDQDGISDDKLTEICNRLYDLYARYYEPDDQLRVEKLFSSAHALQDEMAECSTYEELFSSFMSMQMRYEKKVRWGNNAPRDLFSIDDILEFYPNAKIIVCVRDVRAFLLSYKGKWKVTGDEHVERLKKLYHPVITSLLWKASMKLVPALKKKVPKENLVIVKYEDMVISPEKTVRYICDVIEEDYEPRMLNVMTHNSSNVPERGGIFSTSVDRWKTDLKPEEIKISQMLCKKQLYNLGYDLILPDSSLYKVVMNYLATPYALWRALDANKEMRGPLLPYVYKRLSALIRS
ncbi:MAG: sulfotransferase [Pseudomonadota bacterium]